MPSSLAPIPRKTLGELMDAGVFSAVNGFACGDHNAEGEGVLQVRPYNVTVHAQLSLAEQKHVPSVTAEGKPNLVDGDILFNNTNTMELVGKTALWRGPPDSVFSNHMTRIRVCDPTVPPRYLANAVHAHWLAGRSQMLARAHVAQASILGERFREIEVPWPDPSERSAFASAFDLLDASLAAAGKTEELALQLKRVVTRSLFTRGLRDEPQKDSEIGPIPESWDVVSMGSLGRVGNGSTPKRTVPEYWTGGRYPWLTSAKMYDRLITGADQYVTEVALEKCHLPRVPAGAVLMAITGQGKTLGHCAVLGIEATISQHVAYMALDCSRIEPWFVQGFLETQYEALRQVASGGGSTKGALTCAFLRELKVPLPSIDDQREIVAVLSALNRKIDLHRERRVTVEAIFRSLLLKLMAGEVRATDLKLEQIVSSSTSEAA